jgi:hypothetical protein
MVKAPRPPSVHPAVMVVALVCAMVLTVLRLVPGEVGLGAMAMLVGVRIYR